MLINADFKALEWMAAVYLSKDKTGYKEINQEIDQHHENQLRFNLPTRLIAKTFVFRLIYGGGAWSYANDPDFSSVSTSEKFWQRVIDQFYMKYWGIKEWHDSLKQEVMKSGRIETPTGRVFTFAPTLKRGEMVWPWTTVLNYPVQGFSADLMVLVRCLLNRKIKRNLNLISRTKLICTVHDSIVLDSPEEEVEDVVRLIYETWADIPKNFERYFGERFDLPCRVEVGVGINWNEQKIQIQKEKFNGTEF